MGDISTGIYFNENDELVIPIESGKEKPKDIDTGVTFNPEYPKGGEKWHEDFREGFKAKGLGMGYGIQDIASKLVPSWQVTDEQRAKLKDLQDDAAQGWGGTAGGMGAELAMMAVPGGAAMKATRGINKGRKMIQAGQRARRGVTAGGEAAAAGAYGASRLPGEGETRGKNALVEAAGSLGGSAVGEILRGVPTTEAARKLMNKGVKLTPGQATSSEMVQGVEDVLARMPFVAGRVRKSRDLGNEGWITESMKPASRYPSRVKDASPESYSRIRKEINDGYAEAWSFAGHPGQEKREDMAQSIVDQMALHAGPNQHKLETLGKQLDGLATDDTPHMLQRFDELVRDAIETASNDGDVPLLRSLRQIKEGVREGMPGNRQLEILDRKYPAFLEITKARGKAAADAPGRYSPKELRSATELIENTATFNERQGKFGLSDIMEQGMQTTGRTPLGGQLTSGGTAGDLMRAIPGPGISPIMQMLRKPVAGGFKAQQKEYDTMLEYLMNPARAGQLYTGELFEEEHRY